MYPNEILIIDSSTDNETETILKENSFKNLKYFKVGDEHRGLTKQRNYGITKVDKDSEVICFLDDDVVLETDYFQNLIATYEGKPNAIAVGGYITNEVQWSISDKNNNPSRFYFDGYMRNEPFRFRVRRIFNLLPDMAPGFMPSFSHARSISFLPPSGKVYPVEFFMGGVSSYRKDAFKKINFSEYFDGYGLYEDLDFCLRASKFGALYVNTRAQLEHFHEAAGRPNRYKYGKMVVRNGWYVWRIKHNQVTIKTNLKFHATTLLLMGIHFINAFQGSNKVQSFTETLGRFSGWISLFFNKPIKK